MLGLEIGRCFFQFVGVILSHSFSFVYFSWFVFHFFCSLWPGGLAVLWNINNILMILVVYNDIQVSLQ